MPIDHSDALVTITLEGLFVICKNDRFRPPRWEIGVLNIPDGHPHPHNFAITVLEHTGNGRPVDKRYNPVPGRNIEIVTDPDGGLPIEYFPPSGPFNQGDPHDHRWIVDLEGGQFHNSVLEARADIPKASLLKHFKQKLFVEGGFLYTYCKTVEEYKRVRNPQDILQLGKVGLAVGVHLPRNPVDAVILRNDGPDPRPLRLEKRVGVRYEVQVKHVCDACPTSGGADFDLYYEVLRARDDTRVSLLTKDAQVGGSGGNEPQVCNGVLLGQSLQLPGI